MKSFFRKVAPFLFALWTFGVMATYFYFYQTYGQFYLNAFVLVLFLAAFFIPLLFSISLPYLFRGKQPPFVLWFRRLPNTVFVPVRSLVIVFYGCTASWILLIFLLKPDIGISINSVVSVFLVTIITLSGFSVGSRLVRRFHIATDSLLERFILSLLLGFGILMLIIYIAGMVGLLYGTAAYALVLSLLFVFRKEWLTLFSDIKATSLPWHIKPFFTFDNFAIITSFILFVFATTGLLSQFAAGWDEMHTYQAFPHAYAEAHRIINFPYWHASGYPQNTEMLFTLAHLLRGFTASAGINVIFYLLIPGIFILVKRILLPKASSPVIVLFFFVSAIPYVMISNDHKIEPAYWSYTLLATLYLFKFFKTSEQKTFLLSCVLMGLAAGTKYNFFSIILPSFLIILFFFPREFNLKKRLANIALCLTIIAACFSPWAVKNILFSGNPVEPAMGDVFSHDDTFLNRIGRSYSEHIREHFMDTNVLLGDQEIKDWKYYFLVPFQFTFKYDTKFFEGIANIGPLYLIFLPVLLATLLSKKKIETRREEKLPQLEYLLKIALTLITVQTALWILFTKQVPWYNMVAFFLLFLPMTITLTKRTNRKFCVSLKFSVVALSLSTIVFRFDGIFRNSTFFIREDNGSYANYEIAKFINKGDSHGLVWDTEGFSLNYYVHDSESRVVYDQHLQVFHFLHKKYPNNQDFLKYLRSMNISYFILNEDSFNGWLTSARNVSNISPQASRLFQESFGDYLKFRDAYLIEIFRSGSSIIYTLKDNP